MDDFVLLGRYVETGCQESFQEIVSRHGGWVFSVALRAVRDRHLAEDVTQAVFIVLARKAHTIRQGTPLSGWLFKVSRFAVSDALKRRTRIKNRENRFADFFKASGNGAAMQGDQISDGLSQTLDEAVACLSEADRQAVLLRFYENKSLAEIGMILEISEEAAKKRVSRSVEKLRKYFSTRGVVASVALLLLLLSQRSAQAARGFGAIGPEAASSLAHSIAEGAAQLIAQAQARLLGAILAAGLAILIAAPTLGGALMRGWSMPEAPASVPARPPLAPETPMKSEAAPVRVLPAGPRFADLYIGYKGETLWRSDAYSAPGPPPFMLRAAEKREKPYAIAVDAKGNYFLKPLDSSFLQSPAIRQSLFDYDSGPVEPSERVREMLSVIESMPASSQGPSGSRHGRHGEEIGASDPGDSNLVPQIDRQRLDEKDWHKMQFEMNQDGTGEISVLLFNGNQFAYDSTVSSMQGTPVISIPEPSGALLLMSGSALLMLARRRRRR